MQFIKLLVIYSCLFYCRILRQFIYGNLPHYDDICNNMSESEGAGSSNSEQENQDILDLFVSDEERSFSGFSAIDENNNAVPKKPATKVDTAKDTAGASKTKSKGKGPGQNKKGKALKRKTSSNDKAPSQAKTPRYDPQVLQELLEFFDTVRFDKQNTPEPSYDQTATDYAVPSCSKSVEDSSPFDLNGECEDLLNETSDRREVRTDDNNADDDFPQIFTDEVEFSEPTKESLANFIVKCCTKQANIEQFLKLKKIKIPSNCKSLLPTKLAPEIYNDLPPASRAGDSAVQDVQKIMGLSVSPLISVYQMLSGSSELSIADAKKLIMDSITLICNAHFELSIRRRYLIKRFLKRRFHQLCAPSNPVGETLFGSELTQKLKEIGESSKILDTKGNFSNRGFPKNSRRGSSRHQEGPRNQRRGDRGRGRPPRRGRGDYHRDYSKY